MGNSACVSESLSDEQIISAWKQAGGDDTRAPDFKHLAHELGLNAAFVRVDPPVSAAEMVERFRARYYVDMSAGAGRENQLCLVKAYAHTIAACCFNKYGLSIRYDEVLNVFLNKLPNHIFKQGLRDEDALPCIKFLHQGRAVTLTVESFIVDDFAEAVDIFRYVSLHVGPNQCVCMRTAEPDSPVKFHALVGVSSESHETHEILGCNHSDDDGRPDFQPISAENFVEMIVVDVKAIEDDGAEFETPNGKYKAAKEKVLRLALGADAASSILNDAVAEMDPDSPLSNLTAALRGHARLVQNVEVMTKCHMATLTDGGIPPEEQGSHIENMIKIRRGLYDTCGKASDVYTDVMKVISNRQADVTALANFKIKAKSVDSEGMFVLLDKLVEQLNSREAESKYSMESLDKLRKQTKELEDLCTAEGASLQVHIDNKQSALECVEKEVQQAQKRQKKAEDELRSFKSDSEEERQRLEAAHEQAKKTLAEKIAMRNSMWLSLRHLKLAGKGAVIGVCTAAGILASVTALSLVLLDGGQTALFYAAVTVLGARAGVIRSLDDYNAEVAAAKANVAGLEKEQEEVEEVAKTLAQRAQKAQEENERLRQQVDEVVAALGGLESRRLIVGRNKNVLQTLTRTYQNLAETMARSEGISSSMLGSVRFFDKTTADAIFAAVDPERTTETIANYLTFQLQDTTLLEWSRNLEDLQNANRALKDAAAEALGIAEGFIPAPSAAPQLIAAASNGSALPAGDS